MDQVLSKMESGIHSYHLYRFLEILSLHGNGVSLLGFTSIIPGEVLIPTMIYFEPGSQVSMDPLILTWRPTSWKTPLSLGKKSKMADQEFHL